MCCCLFLNVTSEILPLVTQKRRVYLLQEMLVIVEPICVEVRDQKVVYLLLPPVAKEGLVPKVALVARSERKVARLVPDMTMIPKVSEGCRHVAKAQNVMA